MTKRKNWQHWRQRKKHGRKKGTARYPDLRHVLPDQTAEERKRSKRRIAYAKWRRKIDPLY